MSELFTGVTFAHQKVSPSDDAIVRRAILPDGKLTGCEITYSGSTLTMAAGQLMICGRQIRNPSAQNWAVVDATSGYARLVLTIDLTRTATKEVFDQVVDSIEYATAIDGFVALEQSDINAAGTKYQVAVCVMSLGTGGITGIVSDLGKCEAGAGLNFKVVGGTTQPADPKENTIWVNTDQPITGFYFAASQPENMQDGEIWLATNGCGAAVINALKSNGILLMPGAVKQYVNGSLTAKTAMIYQDGAWTQLQNLLLGNGINNLGTPTFTAQSGLLTTKTFTANSDGTYTLKVSSTGSAVQWYCEFPRSILPKEFSKITIKYQVKTYSIGSDGYLYLTLWSYVSDNYVSYSSVGSVGAAQEKSMTISGSNPVVFMFEGSIPETGRTCEIVITSITAE